MAGAGRARQASHETGQRVCNPYALRGRLYCGFCERRMQGQYNHGHAYTGAATRRNTPSPATYATLATSTSAKRMSCPPSTDGSPLSSRPTGSPRPSARCKQPQAPPATPEPPAPAQDTQATLADCDARLARYQAALDAGADPQTIAEWTRQVKAERAAALTRDVSQARHQPGRRLTEDDIRALIAALGSLLDVIRDAGPAEKAAIYDQLSLKVTFKPGEAKSGPKSPSAQRII
jgi:site-specific DNA recombinase